MMSHTLLHVMHDIVAASGGVWHWISTPLSMRKAPDFCKDWQGLPTVPPPGAGPSPAPPIDAVQGGLLGMLLAATIPAGAITPELPRGVVLPAGVKPTDLYPISIAFGLQHHVGLARFPLLPVDDYLEFAIGIADLQLAEPIDGFIGPCAILGRLDLNQLLPIILGRLLGLQKVLRLVKTDQAAFDLRSFWQRSTVAFGGLQRPEPRPALDAPDLAPLIRTFAQPIVSRSLFGTLAFTRFNWQWEQGLAGQTTCDLTIDQGVGRGRYVYPPDQSSALCTGAWQIRVPWTMEAFQRPSSFIKTAAASTRPVTSAVASPTRPPG
jgi:hypothetical protein